MHIKLTCMGPKFPNNSVSHSFCFSAKGDQLWQGLHDYYYYYIIWYIRFSSIRKMIWLTHKLSAMGQN